MRSADLTREQLHAIEQALLPTLRYLGKFIQRTSHRNFPDDDPLRVSVIEAQHSLQKVITELRACSGGEPALRIHPEIDERSAYRLGRPKRETH
jgi:hypothetical protein